MLLTSLASPLDLRSAGQTDKPLDLRPGKIETVRCAADATQSYALYLPSTYTSAKRWPMIYFFDPGGRGSRPVELYKDVAEKYGFVIAGSNNSHNFAPDQSKSVNAIWQDTHVRFAIDEHRTYTSGFSGGARVAGAMALTCAQCQIAGVIANGAGYPSGKAQSKDKLLYFFAVGDRDFNWPEVITIRRDREENSLPYRVRTFPGTHEWSPPAVMDDAIEWLVLKAMQSGGLTPDAALVDRLFRQAQAEGNEAEKKNDAIAQLNAYRSLVSDFAGVKDVAEPEKRLAVLKKSASLKAALQKEQQQITDQFAMEREISPKMHSYVEGGAPDLTALRSDILQATGRLRDEAAHSKNDAKRVVASRAFDDVWVEGLETGQQELESRHYEKAEACFELMSQIKDEPWPMLMLAETHAQAGKKKQAVKDLQEAVKRGLKDANVLESDYKLQVLKSDADFQRLVEDLQHR